MNYTVDNLLTFEIDIVELKKELYSILGGADYAVLSTDGDVGSKLIRNYFTFNGGDEDWIVITKINHEHNFLPYWLEKIDSGEKPDCYDLGDLFIYVGSHA